MRKIIRIDFAKKVFDSPTFHDTWDSFIDIMEAIEFAACNLKQRYGVTVGPIELTGEYYKLVMDIPDEIVTGFNIGNHLRGISGYLLKKSKNKDIYAKNKVGNRLLVFSEEVEEVRKPGFDDERRLRLLRDISIMACYGDSYSTEKLNKIAKVLYE